MIKLALIGDTSIQQYTVADRLWELLSVVTDRKFTHATVPLASAAEVAAFFEEFRQDQAFKGFTVAAPWKGELAGRVDRTERLIQLPLINTIYKDDQGAVVGVNTDPLAAQKAVEASANLYKCTSALVIGADGAGLPIASHLASNLGKTTYLYDQQNNGSCPAEPHITCLPSLNEVANRTYDIIINATPLGRYPATEQVAAFAAPLDLDILTRITHAGTIVQETNCLPSSTLLLQMAQHLGLQVITGDYMLVFSAAESLKRYLGVTLDENTVRMLVDEISAYINEREIAALERDNTV